MKYHSHSITLTIYYHNNQYGGIHKNSRACFVQKDARKCDFGTKISILQFFWVQTAKNEFFWKIFSDSVFLYKMATENHYSSHLRFEDRPLKSTFNPYPYSHMTPLWKWLFDENNEKNIFGPYRPFLARR